MLSLALLTAFLLIPSIIGVMGVYISQNPRRFVAYTLFATVQITMVNAFAAAIKAAQQPDNPLGGNAVLCGALLVNCILLLGLYVFALEMERDKSLELEREETAVV